MSSNPQKHFPGTIHIIGGGLWARVIAGELCKFLPQTVGIEMHSTRNALALAEWAKREEATARIQTSAEWPSLGSQASSAFIIANAARDHAVAVERLLPHQTPALVEKPFAFRGEDTRRLIHRARESHAPIAASHVFLFARYLATFAQWVAEQKSIEKIDMIWSDPAAEVRHGDRKSFDPAVPLPIDVLPHVSSLIGALLPESPQALVSLRVRRGGAQVELDLRAGETPCQVSLERNGATRHRSISVRTSSGRLTLDFAGQPMVSIHCGPEERLVNPDPLWGKADGPLASMLRTFLDDVAAGGPFDPRLSLSLAWRESQLADEAMARYAPEVDSWLQEALQKGHPDATTSVRYAVRERLYGQEPGDRERVEARVDRIIQNCRGLHASGIVDFLNQV